MQLTSVRLELTENDRVATITLPGGTLSATVAAELSEAAGSIAEQRSIGVVIINSDGDFCTGPGDDLDVFALRPDPPAAISRLRPPVIAAVSGQCRAEGLEIMLATDIRIASSRAEFAMDHVVTGRVPAWGGTQRLARSIRPAAAVSLTMLGDSIDAATSRQLGLVHVVSDDIEAETARVADTLLSRGPLALELTKEAVHRGSEMPLRDGLRLEGDLNHQLAATEDRAEGLQAFFEKRPPDFSGR